MLKSSKTGVYKDLLNMKVRCVLQKLVMVVVGLLMVTTPIAGYPRGAPPKACAEMTPGHGAQAIGTVPFVIEIDESRDNIYTAGQEITVRVRPLNENTTFRGILLQMRHYDNTDSIPVGRWIPMPDGNYIGTRTLNCNGTGDSVTHISFDLKSGAAFTWMPPPDLATTTRFQVRATVAEEKSLWWRDITSDVLTYSAGMAPCPVSTLALILLAVTSRLLI